MHSLVGALRSHSLRLHSKPHLIAVFAGLKSDLAYQVSHWLINSLNLFVYQFDTLFVPYCVS